MALSSRLVSVKVRVKVRVRVRVRVRVGVGVRARARVRVRVCVGIRVGVRVRARVGVRVRLWVRVSGRRLRYVYYLGSTSARPSSVNGSRPNTCHPRSGPPSASPVTRCWSTWVGLRGRGGGRA